jgi:hypothetical protein
LQYTRTVTEEEDVEVVRNHEDGTRTGVGSPVPKAVPRGTAGSGLRCWQDDGGAIFGQTQERQSSRATDWTDGPEGVGKDGIEGQEGRADACFTHSRAARARVLEDEPPRVSAAGNVRRAVVKPRSTTSLGHFPPSRGGPPSGVDRGDGGERDVAFRKDRGGGPVDPMNPILDRPPEERTRGRKAAPRVPGERATP